VARLRRFVVAGINVALQEQHPPERYVGLLQALFNLRSPARVRGDQLAYAKRTAEQNAYQVMQASTNSLAQSDIMMALKQLSAPIKADTAASKVLILASDGLENSDVSSVYGRGTVRDIDPDREMAKAAAASMVGDFGGTKAYVIGGAMMPPPSAGLQSQRDGYRGVAPV